MTRGTLANVGLVTLGVATQGTEGGQLYGLASQIGAAAWMAKYGRDDELESDYYAMEYMAKAGYDLQGAVELQQTFVKLSASRHADFLSNLFASHPPSEQRVAANKAKAANAAPGQRYRARYQKAIAQLKKDAPAYEAEKLAKKALADKKGNVAIAELDKAIAVQPNEGQFWELRGEAWQLLKDNAKAEQAYTTAISKNEEYFSPYLGRGVLLYKQGQRSKAKKDLQRSYYLLPTPAASFYLGELSLESKNYTQANSYFQLAAQDRGAIGTRSREKLQALQLQTQPQTFLTLSSALNNNGYILINVANRSPRAMQQIVIEMSGALTSSNTLSRKAISVPGTLQPGANLTINTGIVSSPEQFKANYFRASVLSATLAD